MQRHRIVARPDWQKKVEQVGLTYHTVGGQTYWDESTYWEFTSAEIDRIEAATAELQKMCLAAGDFILDNNRMDALRIPASAAARIRETWNSEPPALYGRMDLAYEGRNLKLIEYNADTPTSLVEAAVHSGTGLRIAFLRPISSTPSTNISLPNGRTWPDMFASQCTSPASPATRTG